MIVAFKAFDKDLSCTSAGNRFQYQENGWNEEPEANAGWNGFHCAADPLDCLSYYPSWKNALYYMVLADGDINEDGTDSKISCTRMRLVKQLTKEEFVWSALKYMDMHPHTCRIKSPDFGEKQRIFKSNGMIIFRGKEPRGSGKQGEVIGMAKEYIDNEQIQELSIFTIDGENFMEDMEYRVDGSFCERRSSM